MSTPWDSIENGDGGPSTPPKLDLPPGDRLPTHVEAVLPAEQQQLARTFIASGLISGELLKEAANLQVSRVDTTPLSDLVAEAFKNNIEPVLNKGSLGKDGYIPKPDDAEVKELVASHWVTQTQVDNAIRWQNESLRDRGDLTTSGDSNTQVVRSFKYALGENLGALFALAGNK